MDSNDEPRAKFGPTFASKLTAALVEKGILSHKFVRQARVFEVGFSMFCVGAVLGRR